MQIPPEERPKIIALSAGIVLVICVFGFTVVPRLLPRGPNGELLHGSTPTAAAVHPTSALAQQAAATPSAGSAAPSSVVLEAPSPMPSAAATDPFWRPLALSLLPPKPSAATVHPPATGFAPTSNPGFQAHSGPVKLAPAAPPPLPDVELQGIVQDETAMAVLAIGGQVRFLKAGESLEGGWVLYRIQTATVILRQGQREVVLTLGQTLLKETPQEDKGARGMVESLPPFHSVTLQP